MPKHSEELMSGGEISVNGVSVVFCDRCDAGYEGADDVSFGGALVIVDRAGATTDDVSDVQSMSICPDCLDELDEFIMALSVPNA